MRYTSTIRQNHPFRAGLFILLLLGFFLPGALRASHMLGGFIEYTYMGPNQYHVKFTAYRDCSGIQILTTQTLNMENACNPGVLASSAVLNMTSMMEIPSCDPSPSYCQGGTRLGIEKYTFEGIVSMPGNASCPNITMYIDECCRSSNITNLAINAGTTQRISTTLNLNYTNNSPTFTTLTTPYWCVGYPGYYSFNATDVDGDQLTYSFTNASDAALPATYNAGFTPATPVMTMAQGPNALDPNTGMFTFMGSQPQVAVVSVLITESRGGVQIGTQYREIAIPIMACAGYYCGSNTITGTTYWERNANCLIDGIDQGRQNAMIEVSPSPMGPFYALPNASGYYEVRVDSGIYNVNALNLDPSLWTPLCPLSGGYNVNLQGVGLTSINNDFGYQSLVLCAQPNVDIGTTLIRPCSSSVYVVNYSNSGTADLVNANVTVTLDPDFTYVTSSIPYSSASGNTFVFPIGTLPPGTSGSFTVTALYACNPNLTGLTVCAEASIDPHTPCTPPDSTWDRSSVSVNGNCVNDSLACFTILNTGSPSNGNMLAPSTYRIYENNVLVYTGTFQLCGGCDTTICWPANGNTIRLEADQRPGHPGNSHPNDHVEDCGSPNLARNQVLQMPLDDADPFVDIYCRVVVNSFDPNIKSAVPTGTGPQHIIYPNGDIEYTIQFQNLGTAPAYTVVITDTLDTDLDITTVRNGASSHPCTFSISGHRQLQWVFNPIYLTNASFDLNQSMGFVKFTVSQNRNLPVGTQITNRAGIVFDHNPTILTPIVNHTIGENPFVSITPRTNPSGVTVSSYPNPFHNQVSLDVKGLKPGMDARVKVYNLMGQKVADLPVVNGKVQIATQTWNAGLYLYNVESKGTTLATGKMVMQ